MHLRVLEQVLYFMTGEIKKLFLKFILLYRAKQSFGDEIKNALKFEIS